MKLRVLCPLAIGALALTALLVPGMQVRAQEPSGKKLALLVGIDNYRADIPRLKRDTSVFGKLNASLDAKNLHSVLTSERYKFDDVLVLDETLATKEGIKKAFRDQLINKARPGDVVVFMYSGHGDTAPDDNGDERDGKDEAIVPYDWTNDPNSYLRDDDMQKLINELAAKMSVGDTMHKDSNITVIFDSCHSGTVTRGRLIPKSRLDGKTGGGAGTLQSTNTEAGSKGVQASTLPGGGYDAESIKAANYVLLSACQSDQLAYETFDNEGKILGGALVHHLSRILTAPDFDPKEATYSSVFERTKIQVQADKNSQRQTPALEGNVNQLLFAGKTQEARNVLRVKSFNARDTEVTLNAGRLLGVAVGAKYALYPANANVQDETKKLADATITNVDTTQAKAKLSTTKSGALNKDVILDTVLVLTEYPASDRIKVLLDGTGELESTLIGKDAQNKVLAPETDPLQFIKAPAGTAMKVKAESALATKATVSPEVAEYDYYITRDASKGNSELVLRNASDKELARVPEDKSSDLRTRLLREWRWQALMESDTTSGTAKPEVELKIIRLDENGNDMGEPESKGGQPVLYEGDKFRMEVINRTNEQLAVTVANLDPQNVVSAMFPYGNQKENNPEVNRVNAGETLRIANLYEVAAPVGSDVYKVIALPWDKQVNLSVLFDSPLDAENEKEAAARRAALETEKRSAKGVSAGLVDMLASASAGTRSTKVTVPATKSWYVSTSTIQTLPHSSKAIVLSDKGKNN